MVVAFYFRLHLAYFPRPVVAIFARPEQNYRVFTCQVALIRIFLFLPFENIYVLQRTPKFTYRPLFSANPKSHPPANQLLLD